MNPVTLTDVQDRYQAIPADKQAQAQALLADAWAHVTARVPTLEGRLAAGSLSTDLVRSIVSASVIRVLRNPEGWRSWSVDDAQFVRDTSGGTAGALHFTSDELALLDGSAGVRGGFTGSLRMDI